MGYSVAKPRVLHIVPAYFGDGGIFGGAERYSLELAREMAKSVPTSLLSFGDCPQKKTLDGGLHVEVLSPPWYVRRQRTNPVHPGVVKAILSHDVIHCHQHHTLTAELTALLGKISGRQVFASDLGGGGWGLSSRFKTDRWFHGHLHISEYSKKIAGQSDWENAKVIYGGIDLGKFYPDPAVQKEPLVIYAGRLMPHKGINYLIEALPPGLTLELIGRPYDERYFSDLKKLAKDKCVQFRSGCDDEQLIHAYRRGSCVVLPSVYRDCYGKETLVPELLGQTLLEGMACGTPAICTSVASMPEVVSEGKTGFVVAPNDPAALRSKLEYFRDYPAQVSAMGEAGRARVETLFSWPRVVSLCLKAYGVDRACYENIEPGMIKDGEIN